MMADFSGLTTLAEILATVVIAGAMLLGLLAFMARVVWGRRR